MAKSANKAGAKPCITLREKQQIVEYHHERNYIVHKNIACVKSLIGGRCLFGTVRHKQIGNCGHGYTHGYGTSDNGLFLFRAENSEKKKYKKQSMPLCTV